MSIDTDKPGTYVITDVPSDKLPAIIAACPDNAQIDVKREPDGEWTVTIIIPEEEADPSVLDDARPIE